MRNSILAIACALALLPDVAAQISVPADSLSRELQEVIVTARQPATRLEGTTLVSTIAGSALQNLGTCLDVLAQLPMIKVTDADVQIVGKGAPEIFIDGRPMRDADELRRLQSADLSKVELQLAPGAMYGGETQAVLKITTRRRVLPGLSLTERAEATMKRKWSASELLDLNYRLGRWEFFASGAFARNNSLIKGTTTNSLVYGGLPAVVGSTQRSSHPSLNGTVRGGLNYAAGELSLGASYRFNPERGDFSNVGTEWLDSEPPVSREISRRIRARSYLLSAYFDDTFSGKYTLHFDGDFRRSTSRERTLTSYPAASQGSDVASCARRRSSLLAARLFLTFPLGGGKFTAGTQDSHSRTNLDHDMLTPSVGAYIPSSETDTRQTSAALFASWDGSVGPLGLTAGLRYEYVDYLFSLNGKSDPSLSRRDRLLTPDLALSWAPSEQAQVSLSYRMTTVRPPYSQLTGSLNYVGRHEIEGGNPALRDERMHDLRLFGMWRGFMLQADYTRSVDSYAFVKRLYSAPDLQLIMQPVNINVSAIDLYLIWSKTCGIWTPNFTAGVHRQWLRLDGVSLNRPIFSYYLENMLTLPRDFILTLNAFGQTSGDIHTNRFGATCFSLDASISKSFLNKSLQLKLSATDIFNTRSNDWSMRTFGVLVDKRQSYDRRALSLSLTWRFRPRPSAYKGLPASSPELRRL